MKALEKDRNRRYESASAMADDVMRYLNDAPVQACPPSALYRFKKYARHRKGLLTAACAVGIAVLTGALLSVWQAMEAIDARQLADERLVLANERLVLADARLENEKKASADADFQRRQASANLQQALDAVDQLLLRVADERMAGIPGTEPVRKELYQDALKFYEAFFQQAPDDPQLRKSIARGLTQVGEMQDFLGAFTKAQESRREAIQRWEF